MEKILPLIRFNLVLLAGILACTVLFYARDILILLAFGTLFAMVMNPLAEKLEKKIKRIWSTIICVFLMFLIICAFISIVSSQFVSISNQMPEIEEKFNKNLENLQEYIQQRFSISPKKQMALVKQQLSGTGQSAFKFASGLVAGVVGILAYLIMILVFMFLFLLQRDKYKAFFVKIYATKDLDNTEKVINKIVDLSHSYLVGLFMSIIIITVLYSVGFLIVGIKNAVLLAAIAAILLIIPYVGPLLGGLFPLAMALMTGDTVGPALGVLAVMVCVQTIDNNFIEPIVIGGQVKLSAVATIVALFAGGLLWGIPGVILFIPITGILKIIFDHIEPLRPYGYLLGDQETNTPSTRIKDWIKGVFRKKKVEK